MDIYIPFKRYKNLAKEERAALYNLRDDPTIIKKGVEIGLFEVVWDMKNFLKDAYEQLEDSEVYE